MTIIAARAIWERERHNDLEGWLDIQARVAGTRPLTPPEQEAGDVLWAECVAALEAMAAAARAMATALRAIP